MSTPNKANYEEVDSKLNELADKILHIRNSQGKAVVNDEDLIKVLEKITPIIHELSKTSLHLLLSLKEKKYLQSSLITVNRSPVHAEIKEDNKPPSDINEDELEPGCQQ